MSIPFGLRSFTSAWVIASTQWARWNKAYADRSGDELSYLRIDPLLDPLRGDPRFEALAEKIVPAREFAKAAATSK